MNQITRLLLTIDRNVGDINSNLQTLQGILNTGDLVCPGCGAEVEFVIQDDRGNNGISASVHRDGNRQ